MTTCEPTLRRPYRRPELVFAGRLLPEHADELRRSGIDPLAATAARISSVTHAEAVDFGIRGEADAGGVCFRYWRPDEQGFSSRFVRLKPDRKASSRKYLQPVGERPILYFVPGTKIEELQDATRPVLITEGEKKTLALDAAARVIGLDPVTIGLGGCWSWRWSTKELQPDGALGKGPSRPIADLDLIAWPGRAVVLVFDSDVIDNEKVLAAETALARELHLRGAKVRIARIPGEGAKQKVGIDDLVVQCGADALRALLDDAWTFDGRPCPQRVHLSDIEQADLGGKRLAIDMMVSAIGETYLVPRKVQLRCTPPEEKPVKPKLRLVKSSSTVETSEEESASAGLACQHGKNEDGTWEVVIGDPEVIIDLTRIPARQLYKRLHEHARHCCPNASYTETIDRQTVTSFLATPKARRLVSRPGAGPASQVVDESGKPFREKVLYHLGRLDASCRYFRGVGVAVPNPKSQEASAFLWDLIPLTDEFEGYIPGPAAIESFVALQAGPGAAWEALRRIAHDITEHVTQIYGAHRELALLGKLLVFHAVRQFAFDGEALKRGWLEMLEVGDTGQGKTQQVDRIIDATGMGEAIDGVSATRTGIAFSFQRYNETWFLVWGKYPLNDGKLLFIDEAQKLSLDDIDKIRKGRSDGVIAADGVRSGEHPTRVRLIASCNPRHQGVVDDQLFGIELVKQTFRDEDLRRFDFAIISSSSDDKAGINERRPAASGTALIRPETLAESVRWAWSRRPEHVRFDSEAVDAVYATARRLAETFDAARDIPLFLESDARHKLARLAVAVAALLHSTDDTHQIVSVTVEHVVAAERFLATIYAHPNCCFDLYARLRRNEADLSENSYGTIWSELRGCEVDSVAINGRTRSITLDDDDLKTLLLAFVNHSGQIGRQDLAGELGKSATWISKIVRVLRQAKLVRTNRGRAGGYQATPKFTKFLKTAIARGDLQA